jgi:hypothetical protein
VKSNSSRKMRHSRHTRVTRVTHVSQSSNPCALCYLKSYCTCCHKNKALKNKIVFSTGIKTLFLQGSWHFFYRDHGTFSTGIMAQAFFFPQPRWLMHSESSASRRLSLTLLNNKTQKGFHTIDGHSDSHLFLIHHLTKILSMTEIQSVWLRILGPLDTIIISPPCH